MTQCNSASALNKKILLYKNSVADTLCILLFSICLQLLDIFLLNIQPFYYISDEALGVSAQV